MRDIVIPYQENNTGELEACMSLIEKNVPYRKIYVLEEYNRTFYSYLSHVNQIQKLKWALDNLDLTDEIYLFNDDFFVLEPVKEIPYLFKGSLEDHYKQTRWTSHKRAMKHTLDFVGNDALSYEMHLPFLFERDKMKELIEEIEPLIKQGKCPLIRSSYGNKYDVGGKQAPDVKNVQDFEGLTFLSTDNRSFRKSIGEYIRSKL